MLIFFCLILICRSYDPMIYLCSKPTNNSKSHSPDSLTIFLKLNSMCGRMQSI